MDELKLPLSDSELPSMNTSVPVADELAPTTWELGPEGSPLEPLVEPADIATASVPLRVPLANAPRYVVRGPEGASFESPPLPQARRKSRSVQSGIVTDAFSKKPPCRASELECVPQRDPWSSLFDAVRGLGSGNDAQRKGVADPAVEHVEAERELGLAPRHGLHAAVVWPHVHLC